MVAFDALASVAAGIVDAVTFDVTSWVDCNTLVDIVTFGTISVFIDKARRTLTDMGADSVDADGVFVAVRSSGHAFILVRAVEAISDVTLFALALAQVLVVDALAIHAAFSALHLAPVRPSSRWDE